MHWFALIVNWSIAHHFAPDKSKVLEENFSLISLSLSPFSLFLSPFSLSLSLHHPSTPFLPLSLSPSLSLVTILEDGDATATITSAHVAQMRQDDANVDALTVAGSPSSAFVSLSFPLSLSLSSSSSIAKVLSFQCGLHRRLSRRRRAGGLGGPAARRLRLAALGRHGRHRRPGRRHQS